MRKQCMTTKKCPQHSCYTYHFLNVINAKIFICYVIIYEIYVGYY